MDAPTPTTSPHRWIQAKSSDRLERRLRRLYERDRLGVGTVLREDFHNIRHPKWLREFVAELLQD